MITSMVTAAHEAAGVMDIAGVRTSQVRIASSWVHRDADPEPPFLNSFFLDDLATVAVSERGPALAEYLRLPGDLRPEDRVDVRQHPEVLINGTQVRRLPWGRWLSDPDHALATSQQFAVNEALDVLGPTGGLLGVNGPPGTGKTTMLRDIVAGNVVARAQILAALDQPGDAFVDQERHRWKSGRAEWQLPQLKQDLVGYEMVVASSNNAAVANVSSELPRLNAIDEPWRSSADYFAGIAGLTSRDSAQGDAVQAWGLVAARLGNAKNRNDFDNALWKGGDATGPESDPAADPVLGLQEMFTAWRNQTAPRPDWAAAKRTFVDRQAEVTRCLAVRTDAETRLRRGRDLTVESADCHRRIGESRATLASVEQQWNSCLSHLEQRQREAQACTDQRQRHMDLRPGWWRSILSVGAESKAWRATLSSMNTELDRRQQAVSETGRAAEQLGTELTTVRRWIEEAELHVGAVDQDLTRVNQSILGDARRYGRHHPGNNWLVDDEQRELNSAWSDPEINRARADLFEAALELHRAFLANAQGMHRWLIAATKIMRGSVPPDLDPRTRLAGWQLFFMIVPLVSTTFASVGRMFRGVGTGALGWLMIDEAGQAPPQQAVGAIWRARRVLVVGDPLQLTPVTTVPRKVQEDLATHFRVDELWVPSTTSVQQLADRVGRYGTYLPQVDGRSVWVSAPLRVHRRCAGPMFQISNKIAYDNLMINGVKHKDTPKIDRLPPSKWIHVPATTPGTHLQPDEITKLNEILLWFRRQDIAGSDIIAISPFRAVSAALARVADHTTGMAGGTVHTAQGREAEIVFLVLGGDPNRPGVKRWASETPNLVNVATSRARRRLYVIGDRTTWSTQPFFQDLSQMLE
ncbi:AAA family ATPase [Nakamurella silvestris]|nr:AAA family ATPase [Nakamurella silvestris]